MSTKNDRHFTHANQKAKFTPGRIVATSEALGALAESGQSPAAFLDRHLRGDWGMLGPEDTLANEQALLDGERLFSRYLTTKGEALYIITEWDRSVTTLLLPEEY